MTWYGAARPGPSRRSGPKRGTSNSAVPGSDELGQALAEAAVKAIGAVGGHAGGVYLRSETQGLLRLGVLMGLPGELFRPWWRMHVNRPFPVAEAFRSGRSIQLADAEEAMRRFPQLMAGLPFPFGSLYAPVTSDRERFGVLVVLRPATPGIPVARADIDRLDESARKLGSTLARLEAHGTNIEWRGEPIVTQAPEITRPPVRIGHFDWDIGSGALTADADLCDILGTEPARFPGTIDALAANMDPEDVYQLWAVAHEASLNGRSVSRRMRLLRADGTASLVEFKGQPVCGPAGAGGGTGSGAESDTGRGTQGDGASHADDGHRLTGILVDLGAAAAAGEAGDRLPDGLFALDRSGRITYVNRSAQGLLGGTRAELTGRVLWEAVPWLDKPAFEDYYRAALLSDEPVRFQARRTAGEWIGVALYPGHLGVTGQVSALERPSYERSSLSRSGDAGIGQFDSPADRASALYRPVALAIALTEAVTARQVSAVVTEELLPAFGGRQLAIYVLHERHLYLAWETGFPPGFLEPFEGVGLDARLPGVETLTTGRPIFFESMDQLAAAYPGILMDASVGARAFLPLIASGRPVGTCILGFDQPRGFAPEERTVLTALAGLIAQALARAQRYDTEAALARGLQDALLPRRLPESDNVEIVARYLPGTQGMDVGGDWYDVIETCPGLALVIGDVQGHGVSAAATMGQLRSAVRAFALADREPEEVMSGTNRLLIDLDPGQFATCCYVRLDPETGLARAVRAGHPQPLLRCPDGRTEVLDLPGGIVLGVDEKETYPVSELTLEPGAVLALYTDGLIERPGADIDLGVERLRDTLARAGGTGLTDAADRLMREARQAADRADDIALLLTARWSDGEAERSLGGPAGT
ncbi:SpoIIE family protein phosphatase [Streptomyces sp. NPDC059909]|uniref:SpoIIE family protein phosphatase n=1 Tax=Streptomyces sp. NPDC059909 TaxID=3346998 RepID=UPI0036520FF2